VSSLANWLPNFKQTYGDFTNPLPEENTIADHFGFLPQDQRPGQAFNVPIVVSLEHGITADNTGTAFAFRSAIDSVMKNATLDGATLGLIGNIPYDVSFKGKNGAHNGSGGGAFRSAFELKTSLLMQSMEFYRELSLLYGAGGTTTIAADIGVVQATVVGTNLGTGGGQTCPITLASWSPGIYNNMIGALVDVYQADGTTLRAADVSVTAVNPDYAAAVSPSVQLFKSGSSAVVAATDRIVPGGWISKSCIGLEAILKNTGTMFGINAATYPLWKAVQFSAGGAMSRQKIGAIAARLFPNGLDTGGKFFVSAPTFADLAQELDTNQRFISDEEAKRTGTNNIQYKSPAGRIDVALHKYMKNGEAMFVPNGIGKRVGSTDITFRGEGQDWFFLELPSNAGCQLRIMSNQAPFLRMPYRCAYVSGIVNSILA
jgi:hypothetical protein